MSSEQRTFKKNHIIVYTQMPNIFSSRWKKFVRNHNGGKSKRRRTKRRKHKDRRKTKKSNKKRRTILKNLGLGKNLTKPPSSLSIFPDKSPQLQHSGEPTRLNKFTTKNLQVQDDKGRAFNAIINGRLAYRRAPRGQNVQVFPHTIYGPPVKQLTPTNFKSLRKGQAVYYDRGSVLFRGPFIFKGLRRGPELLFGIRDSVYNKQYLFSITVKRLKDERLFMATSERKEKRKKTKNKRRKRGKTSKRNSKK